MPGWCARRITTRAISESIPQTVLDRLAGEGVRVVRDGSFLAVAAPDEFQAVEGGGTPRRRRPNGTRATGLATGNIYDSLRSNERVSLPGGRRRAGARPGAAAWRSAARSAAITLEARYERPYQMHASLGPSAAMAEYAEGRLTVVSHSQGIYFLRAALAEAFDMAPGAIRIVHAPGAGCYGHNGADDAALDAAIVARAHPRRAGAAQVVARGRARLGALRDLHVDGPAGERGFGRKDRRLVA